MSRSRFKPLVEDSKLLVARIHARSVRPGDGTGNIIAVDRDAGPSRHAVLAKERTKHVRSGRLMMSGFMSMPRVAIPCDRPLPASMQDFWRIAGTATMRPL